MRLVLADKTPSIKRKSFAGQLVLVLLGLQMMFFTSFFALNLPTGTGHNLLNALRAGICQEVNLLPNHWRAKILDRYPDLTPPEKPIRYNLYTPQVPVAVFLGYALGQSIATIAAFLFLALGLIGPFFGINPFAGGGGLSYYMQPSFGYLVGLVAGAWVAAKVSEDKRSSLSQVAAVLLGTLAVHAIGLAYLLGSCLVFSLMDGIKGNLIWLPWVFEQARNLSWYPLPYDLIIALLLVGIGFPIKYLVGVLTAPDTALKSKNDIIVQQQMEELLS